MITVIFTEFYVFINVIWAESWSGCKKCNRIKKECKHGIKSKLYYLLKAGVVGDPLAIFARANI